MVKYERIVKEQSEGKFHVLMNVFDGALIQSSCIGIQ